MIEPLRLLGHNFRQFRKTGRGRPVLETLESRELLSTLTVLNLNDSGAGSLRQAIANASPGDTINFAVSGTITLTSGPLSINQNLMIAGPGSGSLIISGNNATQVFSVGGVNFSLSNVTVANASTASSGAGLNMVGSPSTTLNLTNCVFANDLSTGGNGGAVEISGDGQMNVAACTFSDCSSAGSGGAIDSPGVFLNMNGSTLSGNSSVNGGAISVGGDSVQIVSSTLVGNSAGSQGGAIYSVPTANYLLINCTVTDNSAGGQGGGLGIVGGTFDLLNTLVAGNTALPAPDVSGAVFSQGHNLVGITDGSTGWVGSDLTGTGTSPLNADLGTLGNYGGPTQTLPLLDGSPALGAGTTTGAPATDQRGFSLPSTPDIGAAQLLNAVVTSTADSGPGTLRQAVLDTNAHPGPDYITFDIPGKGPQFILLVSALPAITDSVTVDGYTQPGSSPNTLAAGDNAVINIELDGDGLNASGLVLSNAPNSTIRGLSIFKFGTGATDVAGVEITGTASSNDVVSGNFLGLLSDGVSGAGNSDGVLVDNGASSDTIGGTNPADRNVISANINWGFILEGNSNTVAGNEIGLTASGVGALPNGNGGAIDESSSGNTIGGTTPSARNYIAGNNSGGVVITIDHTNPSNTSGPGPTNNVVEGNWIGLNINGASAGGQSFAGVEILNAASNSVGVAGAGNVISGNGGEGVFIVGSPSVGDTVAGNLIGTDPSGAAPVGNAADGIFIDSGASGITIGGPSAGDGNVLSANGGSGVNLGSGAGSDITIQGNLIGTNGAGTAALGNRGWGILLVGGGSSTLIGGPAPGDGNVLSGNGNDGVLATEPYGSLTIQGNLIGLNAAGNARLGNADNGVDIVTNAPVFIGGDAAADRNVLSGNADDGIALNGGNTIVVGNYIGTDLTGMVAIGNGASGIDLSGASDNTIGDTTANGGNVISGNGDSGIEFFNGSDSNTVVHNLIGTAADGITPLANGNQGIHFDHDSTHADSSFDTIGVLTTNGGNVIAFNPVGIRMDGGSNNTISGNSIFGNGSIGLLEAPGANNAQAAPVLTAFGTSSVIGVLVAIPNESYRIEFFATPEGAAPGQGETLLGEIDGTTDGNGMLTFNAHVSFLAPGEVISATATDISESDTGGDTSPFSQFLAVPLPLGGFRITPSVIRTTAGQFVNFTVTALEPSGAVLTAYQGTVTFASVGTDSSPTLPGQYSFTAADNGSHMFSVRYTIAGSQTLGVTDIFNGAFGTATVTVGAAAFDHLTIGGLSGTTPVGVLNSVTVTAVDRFGNVVSGFTDRLHFTSNDSLAQLPQDATLVNGVGTFSLTFRGLLPTTIVNGQSARVYSVTVSDRSNHTATATQTVIVPLYLLPAPVQFIEVENQAFSNQLVATFLSDLANGRALSAGDFTATINWGDGSPLDQGTVQLMSDGATFAVYGSHQYPTGQTDYPVDVTVSFVPTGSTSGFSSQPVTPSVAAVLTAVQFAQLSNATVVRAVGGQTSLSASSSQAAGSSQAAASLTGASAGLNTTLFVATYSDNPVPGSTVTGVSYYDIRATNTAPGAMLTVTFHFQPGNGVAQLMFFDQTTGQFVPVASSTLAPAVVTNGGQTITVTFDATSLPRLSQLQGSVFTIVISPPAAVTVTQTTTISPAAALALPSGPGLTTTREVSFQGSGISIGLTPSEDVVRSAGRAELSGGGDEEPGDDFGDDDIDLLLKILGLAPPDPTPAVTPVVAPSVKEARPAAPAVGPGARLPVPAGADVVAAPADLLFAAAAEEQSAFLLHPDQDLILSRASDELPLLVDSGERAFGGPTLLAIPMVGAVAMHPPARTREMKQRRVRTALLR